MVADQRRELSAFAGFICRSIDRILACLDGLDADAVAWRPPAEGANSLAALAAHTMANAEENILGTLCGIEQRAAGNGQRGKSAGEVFLGTPAGRPIQRDRGREFSDDESSDELRERWWRLREQIEAAFATLPAAELNREHAHPRRGALTGREILIVVARHAAEHQGQAELTRDLLRAARRTERGAEGASKERRAEPGGRERSSSGTTATSARLRLTA